VKLALLTAKKSLTHAPIYTTLILHTLIEVYVTCGIQLIEFSGNGIGRNFYTFPSLYNWTQAGKEHKSLAIIGMYIKFILI
jgi:hypothetical protein